MPTVLVAAPRQQSQHLYAVALAATHTTTTTTTTTTTAATTARTCPRAAAMQEEPSAAETTPKTEAFVAKQLHRYQLLAWAERLTSLWRQQLSGASNCQRHPWCGARMSCGECFVRTTRRHVALPGRVGRYGWLSPGGAWGHSLESAPGWPADGTIPLTRCASQERRGSRRRGGTSSQDRTTSCDCWVVFTYCHLCHTILAS